MTDQITITVADDFVFTAKLLIERAPVTCAAFVALLPYRQRVIHARWSGEACWIPLGDYSARGRVRESHQPPVARRPALVSGRDQRDGAVVRLRLITLREQGRTSSPAIIFSRSSKGGNDSRRWGDTCCTLGRRR